MSRNAKKAPAAGAKDELEPVTALHRITYGRDETALKGVVFIPTSQEESDELFALKAVREPTEAERVVFERTRPAAAVETPKAEAPAGGADTSTGGAAGAGSVEGSGGNDAVESPLA